MWKPVRSDLSSRIPSSVQSVFGVQDEVASRVVARLRNGYPANEPVEFFAKLFEKLLDQSRAVNHSPSLAPVHPPATHRTMEDGGCQGVVFSRDRQP